MRRSTTRRDDDGGMILLFALIFLTSIVVLVTTLFTQSTNTFRATAVLGKFQSLQYAADAAVQESMVGLGDTTNWTISQTTRPTCVIASPTTCTLACPTSVAVTTNPVTTSGFTIYTYCTYLTPLYRNVEITACQSSVVSVDCPTTALSRPLLRAYVTVSESALKPVYVQINDWSVLNQGNS